jgi:hypothetical protein
MNKKIIIPIMFNNRGIDKNELDKDWIRYRLKIFRGYTLKSLVNQTNQHFTVLLKVRDETLAFIMRELRDKPDNVIIVSKNNSVTMRRLIQGYNYLYLVRLDSDDCYEKNYIDMLHNYAPKPDTEALINQNLYDYEIATGRLASYWYKSPPAYVLIYKVEDYIKGKRYYLKNGHGGAILLKHELLKGHNHLSCLHSRNIRRFFNLDSREKGYNVDGSLVWGRTKMGLTEIDKTERNNILRSFGI